ncbi:hypothetical protein D3878_00315 [Noviherbaspirillum sedimenti]|uniref:Uncharacterized protein n=1 Tax=Noviherbaspirillum sedimenti TaxID=2320865 RepID=A0A3A3G163_9BURK|nr:hypothetical protein D3878_00315 [Noviherbaspirillum sedimenti]
MIQPTALSTRLGLECRTAMALGTLLWRFCKNRFPCLGHLFITAFLAHILTNTLISRRLIDSTGRLNIQSLCPETRGIGIDDFTIDLALEYGARRNGEALGIRRYQQLNS